MNEHDTDTFARFARRFAGIEAEIQDPPALGRVRDGAVRVRRNVRSMSSVLAALAVVVVILVVAPFILSGPTDAPTSSVPAAVGSASTPTPLVTTSPAPTGAAVVPLDPSASPEDLPGPCLTTGTIDDRAITTLEQDTRMSSTVEVGTVSGIGATQWNTADGHPPADPHPDAFAVVRLVRLEVETVVKGEPGPVATVSIPGGVIGCNLFFVSWFPRDVEVGRRYVFFLGSGARYWPGGVSGVWQMWPIEADQVRTSFEGLVPLATFIERATAAG